MYTPSDFRKGLRIMVDDQPYFVVSYQHFKMGRGKANIRTKLKHIKSGAVVEKVFSSISCDFLNCLVGGVSIRFC